MYTFRDDKVMILSDPKQWDHILPFIQSGDVPHRIDLTDADIHTIHAADGPVMVTKTDEDGDVTVDVVTTHSQTVSKLRVSGERFCHYFQFRAEGARIVSIK